MTTSRRKQRHTGNAPARQRGVALVLVLWLSVLLAVIIGSFAIAARTETLQAAQVFDGLKARYAAEAGLHRAVFELRRPEVENRWFTDGRPYKFKFEGAETEVRIIDESGKIDINVADEDLLGRLFESVGVEQDERELLVDAILDWRDPDDLIRINGAEDDDYEAAGYPYGAKDAPFDIVGEIQQVMGMNYELFRLIEPAITVHGGRPMPEAAFAPMEVLRVLEGMDEALALDFIAQREQINEFGVPLPELPDGTSTIARSGGFRVTIISKAVMPSGVERLLEATIMMGGVTGDRPFRVLGWKEK